MAEIVPLPRKRLRSLDEFEVPRWRDREPRRPRPGFGALLLAAVAGGVAAGFALPL